METGIINQPKSEMSADLNGYEVAYALDKSGVQQEKQHDLGDRIVVVQTAEGIRVAVLDSVGKYLSTAAADTLAAELEKNQSLADAVQNARNNLLATRASRNPTGESATTGTTAVMFDLDDNGVRDIVAIGDAHGRDVQMEGDGRFTKLGILYHFNSRSFYSGVATARRLRIIPQFNQPSRLDDRGERSTMLKISATNMNWSIDTYEIQEEPAWESFDLLILATDWLAHNFSPDEVDHVVDMCERIPGKIAEVFKAFHNFKRDMSEMPDGEVYGYLNGLFKGARQYKDDDLAIVVVKKN